MILAAGRGSRMQHLTDDKPKPLIQILGTSLLSHIIKKVAAYPTKNIVINTCYKGTMIEKEALTHPDIHFLFSREETALETGGGVKKALPLLLKNGGSNGFFVLNADPFWQEPTIPLLEQLSKKWDPQTMDILLAVVPIEKAFGDASNGNYFIEEGKLRRKHPDEKNVPFLFMGVQILHPRIFKKELPDFFSLRDLYDEAQEKGRLSHIIFDGNWFHVGTPDAVAETERILLRENG